MKAIIATVLLTASMSASASRVAAEKQFFTEDSCHEHAVTFSLAVAKSFKNVNFTQVQPAPVLTTLVLKAPMADGNTLMLVCYKDHTFKAITKR